MKIRIALAHLALLAALAAPLPALAQGTMPSLDDGRAAHQSGNFAEAHRIFHHYALSGDAAAQTNLGTMYANAQGVAQDHAEAARWYRLAAEQGQPHAQYSLGVIYANGRGVAQNYAEAARWWSLSAAQGNASAQYSLGLR